MFSLQQGANPFDKSWTKTLSEAENAQNQVSFKQFVTFRPAIIQPLDGITSKTKSHHLFYLLTSPILQLLRQVLQPHFNYTHFIGEVMLNSVRFGYTDFITNPKRY